MTEIVYALGAQDNLVGVTTFCDFPEHAQELYKVGDFSNPSLERILGLKPDLVIVNTPEQTRIQRQLEKLHINIYESSPISLKDIYLEIQEIGFLLGKQHAAESLISYMENHLQDTQLNKKRVYVELSPRPLITIGRGNFLNDLLALAGGENIFHEMEKAYPVVTQEAVIARDPEIIIILHPEEFGARIGWSEIDAVKNNRVYMDIDQDHLMRPGPRIVLGFQALKSIFND